jgi:hypothetical protein
MRPRLQLARPIWSGRPRPLNAYVKKAFAGNSYRRTLLAIALLTTFTSYTQSQTTRAAAPARPSAPRLNIPSGTLAVARRPHSTHRMHHASPLTSFLSPFFGDSFSPEDLSSAGATGAPPFLLEATRALSGTGGLAGQPDNTREPSSSAPLLIELQGDHYVRVSSAAIDGEALPLKLSPDNLHQSNVPATKSVRSVLKQSVTQNSVAAYASPSAHDLPSAALVFKDGHREQVHDYTIADGFLYARGDYYTDGYWNKKINLANLDVAQTLQANNERSVKFVLPSSPNEVVTRP